MKKKVSLTIEKKLLDEAASLIDGLRVRNVSQAVEYLMSKALGDEKTAVVLCGGPESKFRIGNESRFTAKLGNTTVIEEIVKQLRLYGFTKVFIVARENVLSEMFRLLADGSIYGVKINYVKESQSHGTMDTLRLVRSKISTNFLAVFGDIYFNLDLNALWLTHIKNAGSATLLLISYEKPSERGVVSMEGARITRYVQKPKEGFKSHIAFESIFVAGPEIFEYPGRSLEDDVLPAMAERGVLFGHLTSGNIVNINTLSDLKKARGVANAA